MKWLCLSIAALLGTAPVWALTLRSPADARLWSQAFDADRALAWRWAEGAASATVTVSNLLTGAVAVSDPIARGAAADGAFEIPAASGERLLDVTLVQSDGSAAVETRTARLHFAAASAGLALDPAAQSYRRVTAPVPFAWSEAWYEGASGASAQLKTYKGKDAEQPSIGTWDLLPAAGGFAALRPSVELGGGSGARTVELYLDGEKRATALLFLPGGFVFCIQ